MSVKKNFLFALCSLPVLLLGFCLSAAAGSAVPPVPEDPVGAFGPLLSVPAPAAPAISPHAAAAGGAYLTLPADFPAITVTRPAANTAPGLIFAGTFSVAAPGVSSYLMILDNAGQPVYYQKLPNNVSFDFKALPDGTLSYFDNQRAAFVILDSTYHEVAAVRAGSAVTALDGHELQLLKNGHYLILAGQNVTVDMSHYVNGGNPQAQVLQQIIQEVDRAGNLYWEWPILQHVPVTATNQSLTAANIDYSHCNAIEDDTLDTSGNVLLSCRHLDSIMKINRSTGQILWRLGGKENNFHFIAGPGISPNEPLNFYYQHDIRRLPNGHISLFDNHNNPGPTNSRVLEYALDEQTMTATLVRALHHAPDVFSPFMGNAQLLPNGNTMVGWGGNLTPSLTEYHADGSPAFEVDFADPLVSYRAFRFPWTGHPIWPPALVLRPAAGGVTLTFSWNGATDVASYRILGGATVAAAHLLKEQPKAAGFETAATLTGADAAYCVYQVVPVNGQGQAQVASLPAFNIYRSDPACANRLYLPSLNVN